MSPGRFSARPLVGLEGGRDGARALDFGHGFGASAGLSTDCLAWLGVDEGRREDEYSKGSKSPCVKLPSPCIKLPQSAYACKGPLIALLTPLHAP
jgi:hypothetical protein